MDLKTVLEIESKVGGMAHYATVAIPADQLFELCEVARKALSAAPEALLKGATPRMDAALGKGADWVFAQGCQLERELVAAEAAMDEWESVGGDAPHRAVNLATRIRVQAHFAPSPLAEKP